MILWKQFISFGEGNGPFNTLECGCKEEILNIAQVDLIGWIGMWLWRFINLFFCTFLDIFSFVADMSWSTCKLIHHIRRNKLSFGEYIRDFYFMVPYILIIPYNKTPKLLKGPMIQCNVYS